MVVGKCVTVASLFAKAGPAKTGMNGDVIMLSDRAGLACDQCASFLDVGVLALGAQHDLTLVGQTAHDLQDFLLLRLDLG